MAFDFPSSPTNGQEFTSGSVTYVYNGVGWTIKGVVGSDYVVKSGDAMTGPLSLPVADPAVPQQAAHKGYVDSQNTLQNTTITGKADKSYVDGQDALKVAKAGDTMSGPLVLPADPTLALQAAPKQYVDAVRVAAAPMDAMAYNGMQVNGSMEVSQELGTAGTSGSFAFICDGWKKASSGSMVIHGRQLITPGFTGFSAYLNTAITTAQASIAAGDYATVSQYIEGYRISRLSWGTANAKPITIGFWSGHSRAGVYSVAVANVAYNRSYATTYTHNVADGAQYNVVTIPGDTAGTWSADNTTGLSITFALACGTTNIAPSPNTWLAAGYAAAPGQVNAVAATSDAFRLTGVVVLPGIQAPTAAQSPLIMRPFDQELVTCQRYYQKSYNMISPPGTNVGNGNGAMFFGTNGGSVGTSIPFNTRMRAVPTIISYDNLGASGKSSAYISGVWTHNQISFVGLPYEIGFDINAVIASASHISFDFVADARL